MSKLTSIQKIGFGIVALSILWLANAWNENDVTINDLATVEGKVTDISFERMGKYATDTALFCTLDNGRHFYAHNNLHVQSDSKFAEILKNSAKVKIWFSKDITSFEFIIPDQLTADDVLYYDFSKGHTTFPVLFWWVFGGLIFGIAMVFLPVMTQRLQRSRPA